MVPSVWSYDQGSKLNGAGFTPRRNAWSDDGHGSAKWKPSRNALRSSSLRKRKRH
jgi:hypothetical protein